MLKFIKTSFSGTGNILGDFVKIKDKNTQESSDNMQMKVYFR